VGLEFIQQPGGVVWIAEAPNWLDAKGEPLKIGIAQDAIRGLADRGFRTKVGQLYGVVGPGLIFAEHVYQGLKRDMYVRGDSRADVKKLAITWRYQRDATWVGDAFTGGIEYHAVPNNRVFAVYASPNEMLENFPSICGWAEHWTWLPADQTIKGAPIDWNTRFEKELWVNPDLK